MKFYKLHDSISKEHSPSVKLKTEYFWHYWDFLFTENRDLILVYEPKLSSQISLINKILKHLEWNNGINAKKLLKYLNHHLIRLRFHRVLLQKILVTFQKILMTFVLLKILSLKALIN